MRGNASAASVAPMQIRRRARTLARAAIRSCCPFASCLGRCFCLCHCFCSSFPRRRESSDFKRSRTKGTGFPHSRE
ncbi:hypothetical protein [Lysobacter gummosus]|uniref:hypothetical protein n=1 Tax=Lysobacter gummosus TaxID=262324 RepID=UPI00363CDD85